MFTSYQKIDFFEERLTEEMPVLEQVIDGYKSALQIVLCVARVARKM